MGRLRRNIRSSVVWAGAESVINILAALCTTLVVGRIIGPQEFGLAAIAFLIGSFSEIFVATPFYEPLIQRRRLNASMIDAASTAMLAIGAVVYVLIVASAPMFAWMYEQPRLTGLLIVQGITCLCLGVRAAPEALMARKLRFSQIAIRTIIAKVVSAVFSVVAAIIGLGAWSIILSNVIFAVGATAMVLSMTKRKPKLTTRLTGATSLLSFGVFSLLENLLWSATPRVFSFFVGYFHGVRALGELSIAFRINDAGWTVVLAIAGRLALPMLSRVADDRRRLENAFLQGTRIICALVSPLFLGLALTSHEVVDLILGPAWAFTAPSLIAVCVVSQCIVARLLTSATVKAVGRPSLVTAANMTGLLYVVVGCIVFRHADFYNYLLIWATFGLVVVVSSTAAVQKATGTNWFTQLKPLGPAVLPSLGMSGLIFGLTMLNLNVSPWLMLTLKVALGGLTYVTILFVLERPLLMQVLTGQSKPSTNASG